MKIEPLGHERLVEEFIDEIDGVACVKASITPSLLAAFTEEKGWRFPLLLDGEAPLCDQVNASGYAPASSRFGPYCDNITGMNWRLPNGKLVRVGERVVKSTTGYDLLRFFLGSGGRFGVPTHFVLRLRPLCSKSGLLALGGTPERLKQAVAELLRSSYLHWLESIDWIAGDGSPSPWLRLAVHCPQEEWPIFTKFAAELSHRHQLEFQSLEDRKLPLDGLPDLVLKTTPERTISLAEALISNSAGYCVGLCPCGVVHLYLPTTVELPARITELVEPLADSLYELGGDWFSRHLEPPVLHSKEANWLTTLRKEWEL